MLTFSVNPTMTPDKLKKVDKLITQVNQYNSEYLGKAFISIMEGVKVKDLDREINLNSLEFVCNRSRDIKAVEEKEQVLSLEQDTHMGRRIIDIAPNERFEDFVLDRVDFEYDSKEAIEAFKIKRGVVFKETGADVWRLLELSLMRDEIAMHRLYLIFETKKEVDLIKTIVKNRKIFKKLKKEMESVDVFACAWYAYGEEYWRNYFGR